MSPAPSYRAQVLAAETYDVMIVEYEDSLDTDLGGVAKSPKQLVLALATTANPAVKQINRPVGATDLPGIVAVFEDWAITSWAIPGIVTQAANLT